MANNFASAGVYLIQTFFGLYTLLIMVRVLMQVARADYYNPICQGIVKITDPAIRPFRTFLPTVLGVDFASLAVAFIVQLLGVMFIMMLWGGPVFSVIYVAWVMLGLFSLIFSIYF